ncbi:hypothetical protein LINGRAHAP2_LOCUS22441 [Linum grandiflorum]
MTLVELHDLGLYHIKYTKILGIWYLDQGKSLVDGLYIVKDESDIEGLILAAGSDMQIRIYFEGVNGEGGADNQQGTMGLGSESSKRGGPRSPVDNSVGPEFIHLFDESMRTTNDEFEAALHNMGVRRTKRTVAYMQYSSDEEAQQQPVRSEETLVAPDSQSAGSKNSDYRVSRFSTHLSMYRVNKCFMVRRIGELHSCARNVVVKQATANFLATDFLEDFRNNRGWEVEEIVAAIRRRLSTMMSGTLDRRPKLVRLSTTMLGRIQWHQFSLGVTIQCKWMDMMRELKLEVLAYGGIGARCACFTATTLGLVHVDSGFMYSYLSY